MPDVRPSYRAGDGGRRRRYIAAMPIRIPRLSKPAWFALLMSLSALSLLLPPRCTAWAGGVLQPLGWLQWSAGAATRRAAYTLRESLAEPVPRSQLEAAETENRTLRQQLNIQREIIRRLEAQLAEVSGIAGQLRDPGVRIHIATVIGHDASPARQSLLIARGAADGIHPGDWVIAGQSDEARDPHATGAELLMRQWLVGMIETAHRYTSRVRLVSDPAFGPLRVWAARWGELGLELAAREALLYGTGRGACIRASPENIVETGFTIVVARPPTRMPIFLPLGQARRARPLRESALHYDVDVVPWGQAANLTHVYVLSSDR